MAAELMIVLLIAAMLSPLSASALHLAIRSVENPLSIQDEITTAQIRHVLNLAEDFTVSEDMLCFTLDEKECTLSLINGNLVLKPGTRIYYMNLDDASFHQEGKNIFVTISRNDEITRREIAHA